MNEHEEIAEALKARLSELRTHLAKVDRSLRKPLPADSEDQAIELENQEALEVIAGLRKAVDNFFEQVMVMAENEAVRKNRLALLSEILREFTTIADFAELGGEERS